MADPAVAAVPVEECGEPLVDVRTAAPALLVAEDRNDPLGAYAFLREGVLQRLLAAQKSLPDGLRWQFVEGYRPPGLQRRYFEEYADELRAAHPDWDAARLHQAASRYVSPPEIAPHSAGGAVDLTLVTTEGHPSTWARRSMPPRGERRRLLHGRAGADARRPRPPPGTERRAHRRRSGQLPDRVVALVLRRPLLGAGDRRGPRAVRAEGAGGAVR